MSILFFIFLVLAVYPLSIELIHRLKPYSPLKLKPEKWNTEILDNKVHINGILEIYNPHKRMEIFVPELKIKTIIFAREPIKDYNINTTIRSKHPDDENRDDGYWNAYIVKSLKKTSIIVNIEISNILPRYIENINNLWIDVFWTNYGPFGRLELQHGFLVNLKKIKLLNKENLLFIKSENCELLPVKTHLLGCLDDPIDILYYYTSKILEKGDIVTIGETPLAIMQNRYNHPKNIRTGNLAFFACRAFNPTSSLATACGMQSLIDIVGPTRVTFAIFGGLLLKVIGIKGGFYRLAGEQARLIDDITGTTPPYDQTIVLGPTSPHNFCVNASIKLGNPVAVVDVNDLGRVKILACSPGCDQKLLRCALSTNPAGNANEQTPLVIVRPDKC